jgi:hypothetical protein
LLDQADTFDLGRAAFAAQPSLNSSRMEATMRPTTAIDDNVFDSDYLLHSGTRFEQPAGRDLSALARSIIRSIQAQLPGVS